MVICHYGIFQESTPEGSAPNRISTFDVFILISCSTNVLNNNNNKMFYCCQVPLVCIDSYYYGGLVVTPFNILMYNVFTEHGPNIYGTTD